MNTATATSPRSHAYRAATVLSWFFLVVFFVTSTYARPLRFVPAPTDSVPSRQNFRIFCSTFYGTHECGDSAQTLADILNQYVVADLQDWKFVIVPSFEWNNLIQSLGGPAPAPAVTLLERRMTIFDSSLFSPSYDRGLQLGMVYGMTGRPLLERAVEHELGHAICRDRDEDHAERYASLLRKRLAVSCGMR